MKLLRSGWRSRFVVEVFLDAQGKTRFRVRSRNGETVLQSEGYESGSKAKQTIESLRGDLKASRRWRVDDLRRQAK